MPLRRAAVALAIAAGISACTSEPAEVTSDDYIAALEALCEQTDAVLDALPTPPEEISVSDFASDAASALDNEASRMRRLYVPDDLEADHRALVRNTEEQAAAWDAVAARGSDESDLLAATTRIGELLLGRDDLVSEMGADGCRRGAG